MATIALLFVLLATVPGHWEGTLKAPGAEIPIAVDLIQAADGKLSGTFATRALDGRQLELPFELTRTGDVGPLDRWAAAVGGREKIRGVASTYREATIEAAGARGTIRVWHTADGKYRKEESIAGISLVETFDGVSGTLQQGDAPPRPMTAAETQRARSQAFANWNAVFFVFAPARRGSVNVDGDTIVLAPESAVQRRVTLDPATGLPATMSHDFAGRTITVRFIEYETVDGLRFEKEIHRSTGDPRYDSVIRFTKTVVNAPFPS